MNPIVFFKSLLTGFVMCLPLGPISIIVIRKTLQYNKRSAFVPGLGSAIADLFYGTIAGFSIAALTTFFSLYQKYFQLVAATILLVVAFNMLKKTAAQLSAKPKNIKAPVRSFFLGFFLALFNPSTLFLMVTILTMLGTANQLHNPYTGISIVLGLFCGELLWWFSLIKITSLAKKKIGKDAPLTINKFTGIFLLVLSIAIIIKSVLF
jgi:threonine/homoserine/homoserine lactone efflux protein